MLATATPPISYTGARNLGIGGGGSVTVPNKGDVLSNGISLGNCAASAKPTIGLPGKAAQPNADKTLL
ncbi:hypothetical protein [Burkholderia cepacia]|uniref:hypothetical protein n=1 Tax=Burkholderia cepacia TaxID=292 RepID=UPI001CF15973|nr:hypothetical protein [Burkholderia cepacia]MCA8113036.1 hypothetical protein [Burkholderia cepacia]MCA8400256.1 hypothetical protein [Burkholderia cepacia]